MSDRDYRRGTVPCRTWRMVRAQEEDLFLKRPAVPGRRPPIVLPASLLVHTPVEQPAPACPPAAQPAPVVQPAPQAEEKAEPETPGMFDLRLAGCRGELERLYREQYQGDLAAWDNLLTLLRQCAARRPQALTELDRRRTGDPRWYCRRDLLAVTADAAAFAGSLSGTAQRLSYWKEWGVNFLCLSCDHGDEAALSELAQTCRAQSMALCLELKQEVPQGAPSFHAWVEEMLRLANLGADALFLGQLTGFPHPLLRMARLICELVCPGVLLLGCAPDGQTDGFGTDGKPECHLLCRDKAGVLWHTLATGDVSLLRHSVEQTIALPREQLFLNRLHGDNGVDWALDYGWLKEHCGAEESAHRQYLNEWATGKFPGSDSRGELCREGNVCGTTASLCGVEAADYEQDGVKLERTVGCDLLLHAFLFTISGMPAVISGDEIGQLNDYSCHETADSDLRCLHRGPFRWDLADLRNDAATRQGKQFQGLRRLAQLRAGEPAFDPRADVWTFETGDPHVLGLGRWYEGRKLVTLFNFSGSFVTASAPEGGAFEELVYGGHFDSLDHVELYPYSFVWLLQH